MLSGRCCEYNEGSLSLRSMHVSADDRTSKTSFTEKQNLNVTPRLGSDGLLLVGHRRCNPRR